VSRKKQSEINHRFGKAIRRRRREGERAELHPTYISDIERGGRNPSLENIEKLAKALDTSIARLFTDYGVEVEDEPQSRS
jgi:transcriptional regulator with XRE-family HTH domain